MAGLCYFLLLKGMKNVSYVKQLKSWLAELGGAEGSGVIAAALLLTMWGIFAIVIHLLLVIYRKRAAKLLFPVLSIAGMIAMAFAFGQNDLANCASPGLAAFTMLEVLRTGPPSGIVPPTRPLRAVCTR